VDTSSKPYLSLEDRIRGNSDTHWRSHWSTAFKSVIYTHQDFETTAERPTNFVEDIYNTLYSRPNLAAKEHRFWSKDQGRFFYLHPHTEGITWEPENYQPGEDSEAEPEETAGPSTSTGPWSHREPSRPRADTSYTRPSTPDKFAPPEASPGPVFASMEGRFISMSDSQLQTLVQTLTDKTGERESDRARIRAPTPFNGDKKTYESFKSSLKDYVFNTKKHNDKVRTALSYFTSGVAEQWARDYRENHEAELKNNTLTFEKFLEDTDYHFQDRLLRRKAEERIKDIKCGAKETVPDFFIRFNDLRIKAKMTKPEHDSFLITLLEDALPREVVSTAQVGWTLRQSDRLQDIEDAVAASTMTETTAAAKRKAIKEAQITYDIFRARTENVDRQVRPKLYTGEDLGARWSTSATTGSKKTEAPPYWANDTPMEVDNYRVSTDAPGRVTPETRAQYSREGRCFNCGVRGHMADDARHEEENKEYRRKRDAKKAGNPKGRREEKKTEGRKFSKREQLRSLAESSKKAAENFKNLMAAQQEQINRLSQAISNEDTSDSDSDSDKDF